MQTGAEDPHPSTIHENIMNSEQNEASMITTLLEVSTNSNGWKSNPTAMREWFIFLSDYNQETAA